MVNKPEYIQQKNLETLELKRKMQTEATLDEHKKLRRAGSIDPLEFVPRAPELPEKLKEKQVCLEPNRVAGRWRWVVETMQQ